MTAIRSRHLVGALLLVFAATAVAAASQSLSPDAVFASASTYDGQSVTITGLAKNVQTHTGRFGTIVRYDVCASQCIHVFDRSGATVSEGSTVTATGIFHAQLQPRGDNASHQGHWHANFPTTDVLFIPPAGDTP